MNSSGKNPKEKLRRNKFFCNKKSFIFLLILCLGVGFAFLSSQLTITGNTSVSGNKWSVYFNNVEVSEGSVDADTPVIDENKTTVNYTVALDKPGDFYEFTVDAVNDGTIDAMIDSITTPNIESRVLQYLSYSATYFDGGELAQNDVLAKDSTVTYKIRVEFKKDIEPTDLSEDDINLTLTFGVNYVQSTIKYVESKFAKLVKNSVLSDSSIDFTKISSETNGRGLYLLSGTEDNDYPIYYYRGAVTNNNAKFAGFCWKIVRTTETGGTKLIYNGTPNASGECTNTTGEATQLSSESFFNENIDSPAYVGYMYGNVYAFTSKTLNSDDIYGNTFTYHDGIYTLTDTNNTVDSMHHYTCFNTTGTCTELYYVYSNPDWDTSKVYYITLNDGKGIEDALNEMNVNTNSSNIKLTIENWFENIFNTYFTNLNKKYEDYLEDTIWCNDRSMNTLGTDETLINNGWIPNGGGLNNYLWYSAYGRLLNGSPSLSCSKNDSFTVNETKKGNGALNYPVGLLTSDEVMLAGGQLYDAGDNKTYYLYTNQNWWFISPSFFDEDNAGNYYVMGPPGSIGNYWVGWASGVRPSISIKPEIEIAAGGDGSSATPYEFVVE